jgi:hypothetical protein
MFNDGVKKDAISTGVVPEVTTEFVCSAAPEGTSLTTL